MNILVHGFGEGQHMLSRYLGEESGDRVEALDFENQGVRHLMASNRKLPAVCLSKLGLDHSLKYKRVVKHLDARKLSQF